MSLISRIVGLIRIPIRIGRAILIWMRCGLVLIDIQPTVGERERVDKCTCTHTQTILNVKGP